MTRTIGFLLVIAVALRIATAAAPPEAPSGEEPRSAASPRPEWEVIFAEGISIEEYSRQLDYFKIEVAAAAKDHKVEYISKLSARRPEKRLGRREEDERLYIGWKSGTLEAVDRKLLAKAQINSGDKEILHFFSAEIQDVMEAAEHEYAERKPSEIKRTRFAIRPKESGGYEFVVVEQDPIRPKSVGSSARRLLNPPAEN
jgi:hypothetical protein